MVCNGEEEKFDANERDELYPMIQLRGCLRMSERTSRMRYCQMVVMTMASVLRQIISKTKAIDWGRIPFSAMVQVRAAVVMYLLSIEYKI